jgi:Fur family ferric uptake transcriptional regulator
MNPNESFENALKSKGLKATKQRLAILEMLKQTEKPFSAEQLYLKMAEQEIPVNLSTIYRILDQLLHKKLVVRLGMMDGSPALYEYNQAMHKHYLICLGCKKTVSIEGCPLSGYEQELAKSTGYQMEGHRLDIYGYCPECQTKMKS